MTELLALPLRDPIGVAALLAVVFLVVPLLAERLRVPGIVGLLLVGALIGPNALGWLARDATIELLGAIGLLYLMFVIGLDLDLESFRRYRSRCLTYGAICVVVANVVGMATGVLLLGMDAAPALLLASIFTSHTLLAYPVASRLGIGRNPAVTTGVGAVLVTDTVSLLVLAAVVGARTGEAGVFFHVRLLLTFALFALAVFALLPRLARWYFRRFADDRAAEFLFVVSCALLCAFVAKLSGVQPILAAFFAGLALNRMVPDGSTLMNRVAFTGNALFIPGFLLSVGMLVEPRVFASGDGVWIAALGW